MVNKMLRRLNNGKWNKPPVLLAARKLLIAGLENNWKKKPLEELAFFLNGTSYDVDQLSPDENGELIIRISNITNPTSVYIRTYEKLEEKFRVFVGDLLVSWSASFKTIIWAGPEGILNQHIFKVTEYSGNHRGFIRHAIEATFDDLQAKTVGIGMMHIRRGDFLGHKIPAPSYEVQKTVSEYLDWIEAGCQGMEPPLPNELKEQCRIVERVQALVTRISSAQSLREEASRELDLLFFKIAKMVFEEVSNNLTTIGKAFRVSTGGTPSRNNPSYWNGDVKWVSSGEVAFSQIDDTKEKITELGVAESNAKVYPPNTVLIAMIGQGKTRGQCAILDCFAATNQNVAGIHVYETEHLPKYVYWWLRSRYLESRLSEIGTAQPALSGERVKQMPIPLPPLDEQRRIVAYLDSVQARLASLRELQSATGEELSALLPSVLDRAFKGEL